MATIVEKVIGTGGDYTTLQAWEDACPANLVTADQVWRGKVKNQVFSIAGTVLTVSGTTVDSTRYVELTTDTGASFLDHANVRTNALRYNETNGACIKGTGAWAGTVVVNQNYTRISRLQFSATDNGSGTKNTISIGDIAGAQYCDINQCIFEGYAQAAGGSGGGILSMYGTGNVVRNSLIVQKATPTSAVIAQLSSGASAHNCTFVSLGATLTAGIYGIYGAGTLSNCYIGGVSAPKAGSASLTVTTSHTDATASGYTTTAFSTATFENITIGTHDLRLKSGAGLIDVGTTDATYAASDISGLARSGTYDVGAWESASADTTAPTLTSPSVTAVVATTGTGNVTTDEGNGTLYSIVSTSATAPSAAQIQAGQNHTGAAAVWSGNQAISSTGAKTLSITGLTSSTSYYAHFQHKDSANNNSSVVTSAQFTTSGVDASAPGTTLTGTSSLTAGGASGPASGTASGANLTGTSSLAAGSATGTATGSFTTAAMENNTGAGLLANTAVEWTLYYGTIGSAPSDMAHGSGTTNASGVLSGSGVPLGAADLWVRTPDGVGIYYQRITVA